MLDFISCISGRRETVIVFNSFGCTYELRKLDWGPYTCCVRCTVGTLFDRMCSTRIEVATACKTGEMSTCLTRSACAQHNIRSVYKVSFSPSRRKIHPNVKYINAYVVFKEEHAAVKALKK